METDVTTSITGLLYHRAHALARKQRENPLEKNSPIEVAVVTACGLTALFVLVFLSLVVLASFGVIDGKFLLELICAFRK
ncbi:hypothetical protein [uncultured Mitsuokella sp.]|uniref:hypothetical protein n=1 Tax=uncultured Mitsuokella sp. TaxID=453120 RepID=UPI0025996BA4|nr:hypothetical protein [uncultured Mitsuokella sp.]